MKSLALIALIVVSSSFAQAQFSCDIPVAQVSNSTVIRVGENSSTECHMEVKFAVEDFQPSMVCPLSQEEVEEYGIIFKRTDGKCIAPTTGYVIKDSAGVIRWEQ